MAKLNPTTMKTQYDGQYDTFCRKNHDYGNSFEESLDQFGIIASLVRMQDKMLRLQSLTDDSKVQQVGSESLLDTLEDLSNYAAMTACWLKRVQAEDDVINKSYHAVKDLIEICDDSDVKHNESYHKRMLNSLYGAHIFRTPGENWQMIQCENGFKPLGTKIETELPEETIGMYIDRMLSELYSRIDVWSYNDLERYHQFVKFAEDTVKEIIKNDTPISELQKHIDVFPNLSQKDKNALKSRCMKEYNKVEQVSPNDEEEEIKKLQLAQEELITLLQKSFHISCHRHEFTMNREMYVLWDELIDSMAKIVREKNINEKILEDIVFSHNKLDTSTIMHQIKNANKAKDLSAAKRGFLMIGHRGSGKGFGTIRELLKELGLSKGEIQEIFNEVEDNE